MNTNDSKYTPKWGWSILVIFFLIFGFLLSYIGSDFVIAYAHWSDGIWWGFFAAAALAFSLWSARISSPELALITAVIFFLFISINTQINYYNKSKFELFTIIQQSEENEWPADWKKLDRDAVYKNFFMQRIKPTGLDWLDHLRLQADIGIVRTEQQGHRKYGGRKGVEVYRQGIWMWWGWFVCYLLLAIGCFIGIAGSAFVSRQKEDEVEVSEIVLKRMHASLKEKGIDKESINSILSRQQKNTKVSDSEILKLLPIDDNAVAGDILRIIKLSKEWRIDSKTKQDLNQADLEQIYSLLEHFYNRFPEDVKTIYSYYLTLLAADKLFCFLKQKSFYDCLVIITDISELLSIHNTIQPFHRINLKGIQYKTLSVGELWQPLFGGGQSFYSYNSNWELLENNEPDDIPEDAYLAIIYQYFHQPDPRGYEMWQGTTPSQMVEILAPRLRDAILTYLLRSMHHTSISTSSLSMHMTLAAWAVDWPEDQSEAFFKSCLHSGWRYSFNKLPDTPRWRKFIEKNNRTPFGELSNYVEWFK